MSTAVDIYAFGIMMWEVYTRKIAFRELHYGEAATGNILHYEQYR